MAQQFGSFEKVLRLGEGRRLKRLAEQAAYITSIEPEFNALSDEELRGKTADFRQRLENGEGKTFVASLALYLNALAGTGVHLVTVNDYLVQRDAEWNRGVYERIGRTVA